MLEEECVEDLSLQLDPNFDDDQLMVLLRRQVARPGTKDTALQTLSSMVHHLKTNDSESPRARISSGRKQSQSSHHTVVKELINSVRADDCDKFQVILKDIKYLEPEEHMISLSDMIIYFNANHCAVMSKASKVCAFLRQNGVLEYFFLTSESDDENLYIIRAVDLSKIAQTISKNANEDTNTEKEPWLEATWVREVSWFHLACFYGHRDLVDICLKNGVDVNATDTYGESGVFWACQSDKADIVNVLLQAKARSSSLVNKVGTPAFNMAVRYGSNNCVTVLMSHRPDIVTKRPQGCEVPLILACSCGYTDIVLKLLSAGMDPLERNNRSETALHAAASEGWVNILEILLKNTDSPDFINILTKSKETALHYAVKNNQHDAAAYLIRKGANNSVRNNLGETVWHVAIYSHNLDMLRSLFVASGHGKWDKSISPLHTVAKTKGCLAEFLFFKDSGLDMALRDSAGNTFLHTAAKYGNTEILKQGLDIINPDFQNNSGDTALHEACKAGCYDAVQILVHSCRLRKLNKNGNSALHVAVRSSEACADIVKLLVKHMKKTKSDNAIDCANLLGNTALHIAAKYNRKDVVQHLKLINPSHLNEDGDSALHIAARLNNIEVLEEIMKCFHYEMDINQKTADGETLLHLIAKGGHVQTIGTLIDHGIDLAIQDETGNTFLHDLAEQAGKDPENFQKYNGVFDEVMKGSLKWFCKFTKNTVFDEDSKEAMELKKKAVLKLRSQIFNNDDFTALQLAAKHGATKLVEHMIKVPVLFVSRLEDTDRLEYDITDLVPDTLTHIHKHGPIYHQLHNSEPSKPPLTNETEALCNDEIELKANLLANEPKVKILSAEESRPPSTSLLEVIVSTRPLKVANGMLDIEPLKQVAEGYWMLYQLLMCLILIVHVVYMSLLSAYAIPNITSYNISNVTKGQHQGAEYEPDRQFGLFLIWPIAIFLQEAYFMLNRCYRVIRRLDVSEPAFDEIRNHPRDPVTFKDAAVALFVYYSPRVVNFAFAVLVCVWYHLYLEQNHDQIIVLCYVMLIGWLLTISFTKTFRPMHSFTVMLTNIFVRDVLRFLFLYVFIMLAFGFAFVCLTHINMAMFSQFKGANEVFYQTIGQLLGVGDVMVDGLEYKLRGTGHSPFHYKFLYLLYALVTVVVLLNILIAMMSDTYSDIRSNEGEAFRVSSIQQAIIFEKTTPPLHKLFKAIRTRRHNLTKKCKRWYMTVKSEETPALQQLDERDALIRTLFSKVEHIQEQQKALIDIINSMKTTTTTTTTDTSPQKKESLPAPSQ